MIIALTCRTVSYARREWLGLVLKYSWSTSKHSEILCVGEQCKNNSGVTYELSSLTDFFDLSQDSSE